MNPSKYFHSNSVLIFVTVRRLAQQIPLPSAFSAIKPLIKSLIPHQISPLTQAKSKAQTIQNHANLAQKSPSKQPAKSANLKFNNTKKRRCRKSAQQHN
ncbi:MAG: hypothetical protein LBQ66_01945 [Planctomycetaceae bacterium]|nr:hypothetical protein [Planctomycetaceae bacterium]